MYTFDEAPSPVIDVLAEVPLFSASRSAALTTIVLFDEMVWCCMVPIFYPLAFNAMPLVAELQVI